MMLSFLITMVFKIFGEAEVHAVTDVDILNSRERPHKFE
jgi:hypothetical protein